MTPLEKTAQFIARQLNDHNESPRGVSQETYFTYSENHVLESIDHALSYLYSIKPDLFSSVVYVDIDNTSCIVDLGKSCGNVLNIVGVGSSCDNVTEQKAESVNMMSILNIQCGSLEHNEYDNYSYKFISEGIVQFSSPVPKGEKVYFVCSRYDGAENIPDSIFSEYQMFITSCALWLILLTDNESVSNLNRAALYYKQAADFIKTKLSIEFSLRASDYIDGHQLTPDKNNNNV